MAPCLGEGGVGDFSPAGAVECELIESLVQLPPCEVVAHAHHVCPLVVGLQVRHFLVDREAWLLRLSAFSHARGGGGGIYIINFNDILS